jgi:hypothetical protein
VGLLFWANPIAGVRTTAMPSVLRMILFIQLLLGEQQETGGRRWQRARR